MIGKHNKQNRKNRLGNVLLILICSSIFSYAQNNFLPQQFEINPQVDTRLTTAQGTRITIPANSFDTTSLRAPLGEVRLSVQEAFEIPAMMLAKLSTESRKGPLRSNGMVNISATAQGKALALAPRNSIRIELPSLAGLDPNMNLYQSDSSGRNWRPLKTPLTLDSCRLKIKRIIWDYQVVSKKAYKEWKKTKPVEPQRERLFGGKEINRGGSKKKEYQIAIPKDTIWTCVKEDTAFYQFNIQSLGWYNIDVLLNLKNPTRVKVKTEEDVTVYLIVKNKKVCLKGRKGDDGYSFKSIERDAKIAIVCFRRIDKEKVYYSILEKRATEDHIMEVNLYQTISLDAFQKMLQRLR